MLKIDTIIGAPDNVLPQKEKALKILAALDRHLILWSDIIDRYGKVKRILHHNKKTNIHDFFHDFYFFGITKTFKSLLASRQLIGNLYPEDSQIILRSIYETYLTINYVAKNPKEINHFLYKSIGVATGKIKHPKNKHGKPIKSQIINPDNGQIEDFGVSISKLADALTHEQEKELHPHLYKYLCEHTHLNMISSGNYREPSEVKYTYLLYNTYHIPINIQIYLMIIYLDMINSQIGFKSKIMSKKIISANKKLTKELLKFLSIISVSDDETDMKFDTCVHERLKDILK